MVGSASGSQWLDVSEFVEADAVRLHEEQRGLVRHAHGNVAAGEIVLSLRDQHPAGQDELLFCLFMGHVRTLPLRRVVRGARGLSTEGLQERPRERPSARLIADQSIG